MRHLESYGLSGGLLIAEDGLVVFEEVYGFADRATGRRVSLDTVFDVASLGKQFTAAAVLGLQEEGRLRVEDRLGDHLPDVPTDKASITLHQLLTHTSGLADPQSDASLPADRDAAVQALLDLPLDNPPGSNYSYSNAGYNLLAAIIETASGLPFEEFLQSRLYAPAGLQSTRATWESAAGDLGVAIGSGGYEGGTRSGDPRSRGDAWFLRGSGGILSSPRDLWRWVQALNRGEILSSESLSAMFEPHTTAEADFLSYGYGWRIQKTPRDTTLVWHTGWEDAFSAVLRHYVDEDVVVIFVSNTSVDLVPLRDVVLRSAREGAIGEILFDGARLEAMATDETPSALTARLTGRYQLAGGGVLEIESDPVDGDLRLIPLGQGVVELLRPAAVEARSLLADRTRAALDLGEALRSPTVPVDDQRFGSLDPYGFAGRDASALRAEWRNLESDLGTPLSLRGSRHHAGRPSRQRIRGDPASYPFRARSARLSRPLVRRGRDLCSSRTTEVVREDPAPGRRPAVRSL